MAHESLVVYLLIMQLLSVFTAVVGAKVPAIIVFGDSTVDAGNNNQISTLFKSNFQPYGRDFHGGKPTGRFCNGRLYTDFISEALGIKPSIPAYLDFAFNIQDFATGVTFASAGSGYDNSTSDAISVISLWEQLEFFKEYQKKLTSFLGKEKTTETLREAIYIVSTGSNDLLWNYLLLPLRFLEISVDEYETFLIGIAKNFLGELYKLGARKIAVMGLSAIGCLPISRTSNLIFGRACREHFNKVAIDFNVKLQNILANLREELQGIKLVYSDHYNILLQVAQNPSLYGFENVGEGCCGTGMFEFGYLCSIMKSLTCKDNSKHVFWDAFHPTENTYRMLADYLMKTSLSELV